MAAAGPDHDWRRASVHLDIAEFEDGVAECWLTRGRFDQICVIQHGSRRAL